MKRLVFLPLLVAALLLPCVAEAYVASPRWGAFEVKFGPWRPNADDMPGSEGTYSDFFGNRTMFNTTLELDWQFARIPEIMSFALGGTVGYMREKGSARIDGDAPDTDGAETADSVSINTIPLALLAVFRLDVLPDKTQIPLSPFFKIGLNWYPWWTRLNDSTDSSGGTMGWQFRAGIAVQLDWTATMSARTFDNEFGINHSYIFFEYIYAQVENFGAAGHLHLSPTNIGRRGTFAIGLCLEF